MPALNISIAFCLLVVMAGSWALHSVAWISVTGFVAATLCVWATLRHPAIGRRIPQSPMAHRLFIVAYACMPVLLIAGFALLPRASLASGL